MNRGKEQKTRQSRPHMPGAPSPGSEKQPPRIRSGAAKACSTCSGRQPDRKGSKRERLLALGELEAATRFGPAVFLALHDARVARQEAAALEHAAQIGLMAHQRLRQAVTNRAGLTRKPTAGH